jgi:hypothetical protein
MTLSVADHGCSLLTEEVNRPCREKSRLAENCLQEVGRERAGLVFFAANEGRTGEMGAYRQAIKVVADFWRMAHSQ